VAILADTGVTMEEHLFEVGKTFLADAFDNSEKALDQFQKFVNFIGKLAEVRR